MFKFACPICNTYNKVDMPAPSRQRLLFCEYCYSLNRLQHRKRVGWELEQVPQHELDQLKFQQPDFYKQLMTAKRLLMLRDQDIF